MKVRGGRFAVWFRGLLRGPSRRWWTALAVTAIVGLASMPVLAQPGAGPGAGWTGGPQQNASQPLSLRQAEAIARQVVAQMDLPGLVPGHIMEFSNNFYVAVKEKATGRGAFEFLIDRYTGFVHPEPRA